jgi:hypothetical protein
MDNIDELTTHLSPLPSPVSVTSSAIILSSPNWQVEYSLADDGAGASSFAASKAKFDGSVIGHRYLAV